METDSKQRSTDILQFPDKEFISSWLLNMFFQVPDPPDLFEYYISTAYFFNQRNRSLKYTSRA